MKLAITYGAPIKGLNLWLFIVTLLLLAMWVIFLVNRLTDFETFKLAMLNQPLPNWIRYALIVVLPLSELAIIILLVKPKTNHIGMYLSFLALLIFTIYVAIAWLSGWEQKYCGCAKAIAGLTWFWHVWFNMFFLLLSATGIYLSRKLHRGSTPKGGAAEGGSAKRPIEITNRIFSQN